MNIKKFPLLKFLAPLTLGLGGAILSPSYSAIAAPSLTITPITWNVIGLDSNKPTVDGPDRFMAGARVCNVGDATATNITAKFVKDGGSSFINLVGASTLSIPSLAAGATSHPPGNTGPTPNNCYDFYFNLVVTRNTAAYSTLSNSTTRQQFHIEATATGVATVSTPAGRELYVEKLVSQARNEVSSITGPSTVYQGQTVQYTVKGSTAPGGYEQLSVLPLLPGFFQLISASTTYSTPTGATNNTVYADACGWENDPSSSKYYHNNLTCDNPAITDTYSGDKAGDNITTVYTIKVLSTGSGALSNIIYDFSGSSYHYNADIGTGTNSFAVSALPPQADLSITKTDGQTTAIPGQPIRYTITVTNSGPSEVTGAAITDTVPNAITGVSWTCTASSGSSCGAASGTGNAINTTANLLSGGTATYTVTGTVSPTATSNLSNTASVAVPAGVTDPNTGNNTSTDTDTLIPSADIVTTKTGPTTAAAGSTVTYNITTVNNGPSDATNVVVRDNIGKGLTNVVPSNSGTYDTTTGIVTFPAITTLAKSATQNYSVSFTAPVSGPVTDIVSSTSSTSDPTPANNDGSATNAKVTTTITPSADLSITKTDNQTTTTTGSSISYTITVTNNGPSTVNSVTVADTVPSTIQNPVFTASTGSYNSTTGAWTGLNLATGQNITLTMTGTVSSTATGTITNTATVAAPSGTTDPTAGNNTATDINNVYAVAPTAGKVIINEVLYNETGNTAAANDEFIELYNASNSTVDLSGWKLMDGNIIANNTDGSSGSISGSSSPYVFPSGTTLTAGQYAVIWIGTNTTDRQASGASFQAWLGKDPRLNNFGDDIWLYDSQTAIVDYIAYGTNNTTNNAINTPPPTSLNLWNTTYQASLSGASSGQSISLTANGQDGNASACWEQTTSGQASTRCTGYLPTRDTDTVGSRITTVGQNNNGGLAPLLLLVKRITAVNSTNFTSFVDDPNTTNDNSAEWPASTYLKGAIDGGAVQPGDTVEYTIYFLSDGGSSAQKVNMCDLVPANTTFLPDAFASGSGIARATGSAAPVNLTNAADTDGGQYVTAGSPLPTGVSCNNSNTNGAAIVNLGNIPNAIGAGSPSNSYGFIRFKVKVK